VQLFGINSLDLYSSGVSLQAMGLKLKRYQAVVLDSILACGLTIWAMFQSTFSLYMKEFVGVIIVWIAPWLGIYLMDWIIRKYRYSASELQRDDKSGIYFVGKTGVNWNSIVAFVVGMVCSTIAFSKAPPPVNFPFHWMTPISNHYGGACAGNLVHNVCSAGWYGGADFSVRPASSWLRWCTSCSKRSLATWPDRSRSNKNSNRRHRFVRDAPELRLGASSLVQLSRPVFDETARSIRSKNGDRSERAHHRRVLAERGSPDRRLGHERADDDDLGADAAQQSKCGAGRRTG